MAHLRIDAYLHDTDDVLFLYGAREVLRSVVMDSETHCHRRRILWELKQLDETP
jgi:hypothetical protein